MAKTHVSAKAYTDFNSDMTLEQFIALFVEHYNLTVNEKTGVSIDGPAMVSCLGMTEACKEKLLLKNGKPGKMPTCYAMQGLYAWAQPRYQANYDMINAALDAGIKPLWIGKALAEVIRRHPKARTYKVIRVSGSGDIWRKEVAEAYGYMADDMPEKQFYTYTRAFAVMRLLPALVKLASRKNFDISLSADKYNYELAAEIFQANPVFIRLACMQDEQTSWFKSIANLARKIIVFPVHKGKNADGSIKMVTPVKGFAICPSMTGKLTGKNPCQACTICHA